MHQEPREPLEGPYSADRKPDSDASNADPPVDGGVSRIPGLPRIPSPLLNWRVIEIEEKSRRDPENQVEIEGEATLIEETEIRDEVAEAVQVDEELLPPALARNVEPPHHRRGPREQYDSVVVGGMQQRRIVVMPGESAEFDVTVANHGRWAALFEVSVEGWIDEAWTPDLPVRVHLEPHARQVVTVAIAPPRQSDCRAGEHALAVVVRAARYPGHVTRMAAILMVERFASLQVGAPLPFELDLSWSSPAATTRFPITNQSNYPATVHLQGMDRARQCDFIFYTEGLTNSARREIDRESDNGIDDGTLGSAHLTLQPGQSVTVPVEIRTRQRPFFGIMPRLTPFRLVARMETEPPLRRGVDGQVAVAPLVGPWHMAIAAVLGVIAIFGTGLAGLALLVALRSASPVTSAPPVATAVPAAPVVAFVIQMEQPMPTRAPSVAEPSAPVQAAPPIASQVNGVPGDAAPAGAPVIPVVSADQVTAPGEPTPVGQQPLQPVVVTTPVAQGAPAAAAALPAGTTAQDARVAPPANSASLTYGQMFRQVASQFDLDWRVLAAQAYLESGFDSLALSGQGDMGLMQIRPGTWSEWSPTVNASDPFDAYSNVLVGAAYLNHLREELSARGLPQQEWMLVAYNWGPDKVYSHLDAGGTWETLDPERRQYADDVLRIAASIPSS